jgi:hypothetical protein
LLLEILAEFNIGQEAPLSKNLLEGGSELPGEDQPVLLFQSIEKTETEAFQQLVALTDKSFKIKLTKRISNNLSDYRIKRLTLM